ncbi:enoyl-ACP reductase FabI [Sphingopyxis indica]|nr:enoyl-ACP reductase [Sphingopyxis indica]
MVDGEMMAAGLMEGKRGLVMGVANESSIAWAAAQALHAHGAEMAFTYQSNVFQSRVAPLAERVAAPLVLPANVQDASSLDALFEAIEKKWGHLDFLLHAIAHSDRTELQGRYLNTSRNNFLNTMEISCFSFTDLAKRARPLMRPGASLLTLTYLGSERVIPNYNVMGVAKAALEASMRYLAFDLGSEGIRVNALSPGPMRTLAASGIRNVRKVHTEAASNAPLRRNATLDEVGSAALFVLSDLSAGITGEVIYVDGGYHIMGMAAEENL